MPLRAPDPDPAPHPAGGPPVLPELAAHLAAAAGRAAPEPPGGSTALREAVCGYWERRGLPTGPDRVLVAPGAPALLLALLAALDGAVVLPRPCAQWYAPAARLLGHDVHHVPAPAESGGLPDPFGLLESVRRSRRGPQAVRSLTVTLADDPTGTCPPPEQLHEVCEAAADEGLWLIGDETRRDLLHDPHDTVLPSPAEIRPAETVLLADLRPTLLPASWPVAVARFPDTGAGGRLRDAALAVLTDVLAPLAGPVACAALHALREPEAVRERLAALTRLHAALARALHEVVTAAGALCRPPQAGNHLYVDFEPLRGPLTDHGVTDAPGLERALARWGVRGGHRFGEDHHELRARLSTDVLVGADSADGHRALAAADPARLPHVEAGLAGLAADLAAWAPG
ncbi:aminotransferase class I/II-fold pyridoxal phosphate-dependent enzyme [Streptomyces sp. NPDC059740]|uniref:aminotransferase class I/II-fold pyridoxal phosphate-dependent enzyme n=1 Tax=Streptomyces sp. NPDC059740 TaxID=3346926 RepID=UPI00364B3B91